MQDKELEMDVRRIWLGLRRNALCILALALEGLVAALLLAMLLPSQYQSGVVFYVHNTPASDAVSVNGISSGDIAASKELVDSYLVILRARETLEGILAYAQVEASAETLQKQIQAAPVNGTEFFEVLVTCPDPRQAEQIANAVAVVLPLRVSEILSGPSAKIVDSAIVSPKPQGLKDWQMGVIGFGLGFVFAVGYTCVEAMLDTTIRYPGDLEKTCGYPLLAVLRRKGKTASGYALLRAKLEFLLKEALDCRILGITSSVRGEGKNQVSENLARSLTRRGKKVLLVDCDLRASRLGNVETRSHALGLGDYLSGSTELDRVIQHHTLEKTQFSVIPAGQIRRDFGELLASEKMEGLLQSLPGAYEYVILNLPVMAEAGDCLNLLGSADGIVLTVRRDVCKFAQLEESVRQLDFVHARILGIAYQDVPEKITKKARPGIRLAGLGEIKQKMGEFAFFGG